MLFIILKITLFLEVIMTPELRVEYFRSWRGLSYDNPRQYRIVKINTQLGTFGLEEKMGPFWILVTYLPPWE
jgi:hypothetical protein